MTRNELRIHGHSCCEIRTDDISIICDPWLVGSTYWRSWFNFPAVKDFDELLNTWNNQKKIYIYLTHLHWDHFHGPTLRKIIKKCDNYKFLIPKTPEIRLKEDLESIVSKDRILELDHAKTYKITNNLSILSFQVGPFFADSILSIFSSRFSLLNINDAKIFHNSMKYLLSLIPNPQYVLRSHSSANDRCCLRSFNGEQNIYEFDKSRINYSLEFFDDCYLSGAKFAIPFASNMACLHKETFQYNSILNFADYVVDDFKKYKNKYKGMECKLLLPTEFIDLVSGSNQKNQKLRKLIFNQNRNLYLKNYQKEMDGMLSKQYKLEELTNVSDKVVLNYFQKIIKSTPFFLKNYLNNFIFIEVLSKEKNTIFSLDFKKGKVEKVDSINLQKNNVRIRTCAFVINDVCRKSHWNSLGVSKRFEVWLNPSNNRYLIFNLLCNTIESKSFLPLSNIFTFRYISIWCSRYREVIELLIYFVKLKFFKQNNNKIYLK